MDSLNHLSLQHLMTFCLVYEHGGYAAAADSAALSAPALWEHVRQLERVYGTALFRRRGRHLEPTIAGHQLHETAKPLLAGLRSTVDVIREGSGKLPERYTLMAGMRMTLEELAPALSPFRKKYPTVSLRLANGDTETAKAALAAGEVDMGLTLEPGPGFVQGGVLYEPAYEIDYLMVCPKRHALAKAKSINLHDVLEHPLIVPQEGNYARRLLETTLHRMGLLNQLKIAVETTNSATTVACVKAGLGVGILGGRSDGPLCQKLCVRPLTEWMGATRIVFMLRRGAQRSLLTNDLMASIRDHAPVLHHEQENTAQHEPMPIESA